jgi:DNA-binding transcriptional LysR family regulator
MPYGGDMLDLNRLRILRAVIASGSVSETARRLGYRPSTVSQHLHTLEREVGFVLVERVGRGIVPTPAAVNLAAASADALAAMAHLNATVRDLREGSVASLTIGSFASAAYAWMPSIARTLRQEFPGLTLELTIVDMPEGADGTVDLEVRSEFTSEVARTPPGYRRTILGADDYLVALPPDHELADRDVIALAELSGYDWVEYDFRDDISTEIIKHACSSAGITPRHVARAEDHVTGLAFVAAGIGLALVPALVASWSGFDIRYVRLINPTPQRRIVALMKDSIRTNPAARRTVELLGFLGSELADVDPSDFPVRW